MHALNCKILQQGDTAFCLLPTYYQPNRFIECKVYIEFAWHSETCTYYHCTISELCNDTFDSIKLLSTAQVRCIHRQSKKLMLASIPIIQTLSKKHLLEQIQIWQKDFVLDIPAPFVVSTETELSELKQKLRNYFEVMHKTMLI